MDFRHFDFEKPSQKFGACARYDYLRVVVGVCYFFDNRTDRFTFAVAVGRDLFFLGQAKCRLSPPFDEDELPIGSTYSRDLRSYFQEI